MAGDAAISIIILPLQEVIAIIPVLADMIAQVNIGMTRRSLVIGIHALRDLIAMMIVEGQNDLVPRFRIPTRARLTRTPIHVVVVVTVQVVLAVTVDTILKNVTGAVAIVQPPFRHPIPTLSAKRTKSPPTHDAIQPLPPTPTSKSAPHYPPSPPMANLSTLAPTEEPFSPAKVLQWHPTSRMASVSPDEERSA